MAVWSFDRAHRCGLPTTQNAMAISKALGAANSKRFVESRNRFTPDLGIAHPDRLIGPDVLKQQGKHCEPVFVAPEQLSLAHLNLLGPQLPSCSPSIEAPGSALTPNIPSRSSPVDLHPGLSQQPPSRMRKPRFRRSPSSARWPSWQGSAARGGCQRDSAPYGRHQE
jgi:hypothetical protein